VGPDPRRFRAPLSERAATALTLQPGDHLVIVGNSLGERMQHHGWLEAMLHAQHPQHRLVVRNLAFAGDEVALRTGRPEDHSLFADCRRATPRSQSGATGGEQRESRPLHGGDGGRGRRP